MDEDMDLNEAMAIAIGELSLHRKNMALDRALTSIGFTDKEWNGKVLSIAADEIDDILDLPGLEEAYSRELTGMVIQDVMNELVEDGIVTGEVDNDGEIRYYLADATPLP